VITLLPTPVIVDAHAFHFTADCFADLILITAPIYLLSTLTTMTGLRIRLMIVFSSTIFTTVFSLVHAYAILRDLGFMEFMFAVVEVRIHWLLVSIT
jgi:hypothetical protein